MAENYFTERKLNKSSLDQTALFGKESTQFGFLNIRGIAKYFDSKRNLTIYRFRLVGYIQIGDIVLFAKESMECLKQIGIFINLVMIFRCVYFLSLT